MPVSVGRVRDGAMSQQRTDDVNMIALYRQDQGRLSLRVERIHVGVAAGGCADATCVSALGVGGAFEAGEGSAVAAGRAACAVVVPARSFAIRAPCRGAFCCATLAWAGDSAAGVAAERDVTTGAVG